MCDEAIAEGIAKRTSPLQKYINLLIRFRGESQRKPKNWRYQSVDEFVMKFGRNWTPSIPPAGTKFGEPKMCYLNAANHAIFDPAVTYVEGYASMKLDGGGEFPAQHAWCVDSEGRVIDRTWTTPGTEYFGVAFKTKYVREMMLKTKVSGVLYNMKNYSYMIDDPETFLSERWPR